MSARFNSDSSSSSSSSNESWLYEYLSPIMIDFIESNPSIDYEESQIAGMTEAQKKALEAYGSGASIELGKQIMTGGAGLVSDSVAWMQDMLNGGANSMFKQGVSAGWEAMSPAMENQAAAIQSGVYADMGAAFGSTAQSTMSNSAVSGSSSASQTQGQIMASGANAMTQGIASMQADVLSSVIGLTTDAMGSAMDINQLLMGAGGDIFGAGAGMVKEGTKNQFNAGLFEQWYNQEVLNNDRRNSMINNNMEWIDMAALMAVTMPGAGLKTESSTESSTDTNRGIF